MATPSLSKSAKLYQERRLPDDRTTRRLPALRHSPEANLAHQLPLAPPYPTVDALRAEGGLTPDSGLAGTWPWRGRELL